MAANSSLTRYELGPLVLWTDGERYELWVEDEYRIAGGRFGPDGRLVPDWAPAQLSAGHTRDVIEVMLRERERR